MDKQKQIINVLKKLKRASTTQIGFVAFGHTNTWIALKFLEDLEKDGIVVREVETNSTYWKLTGGKK